VKEILSKTKHNPRKRLLNIYDLCKVKRICEGGDELESAQNLQADTVEDLEKEKVHEPMYFIKSTFKITPI